MTDPIRKAYQGYTEKRQPLVIEDSHWHRAVILIASILLCGLIWLICVIPARAEVIDVDKLANAIYKAENSVKYPYGIKSLKYEDRSDRNLTKEQWARKICINTIKNNLKRFAKQDKYRDFISFLGSRYCPTTIKSEYALNKNWINNVRHFYGE